LGVPVIGQGCRKFPAFWCRSSGLDVSQQAESPGITAALLRSHWALGLAGVVVANPIPQAEALAPELIERAINQALSQAAREGISGKAVTPFLLARVLAATDGRSLTANIALARHNAHVAGQIAVALSQAR